MSLERLLKLKQTPFMAVLAKSRSSLHKENHDFNKLVLNKIHYLVAFNCINPSSHPEICI